MVTSRSMMDRYELFGTSELTENGAERALSTAAIMVR